MLLCRQRVKVDHAFGGRRGRRGDRQRRLATYSGSMVSPLALSTAALLFAALATGQWPGTSSPNVPIGAANGDQAVPRIGAAPDGSCWIAWFDNRTGNYDVRLQRLDPAGVPVFAAGGLVVSSNPQSTSLVDWDLLADRDGCAVVTFTDVRAGGELDVYAYRIDPAGNQLWGQNGVTLSNNADYEANPRVCEASDGDFVFLWPNTALRTLQLQRLDRLGVPRYPGDGIAIPGDAGATPAFARLVAADNGAVIASWVRTLSFTGNKHVHTQKFDALGNALWNGGTRLPVFDLASVPIAHEPRLVADGAGGALYGWHYAVGSSTFFVRVQRVLASGTEFWPHNGVDVSTSSNPRFDPALAWHADAQELVVAWNERNAGQSQWGLFAQRLDVGGNPLWGTTGSQLLPINTTLKLAPTAAVLGAGHTSVAVLSESLGALQKAVQVFHLLPNGQLQGGGPTDASTVASDKLRLVCTASRSGTTFLTWGDNRAAGGADVYAAAVDFGGAIGLQLAQALPLGCGTNPPASLFVDARPAIGTTVTMTLTNPLGTQAAGSLVALALGLSAFPGPCGVPVPGFGMAGPGQNGELHLDLGAGDYVLGLAGILTSPTAVVTVPYSVPLAPALIAFSFYAQGIVVDPAPGASVGLGLTNGLQLFHGS
jgi:hypothetical protein